MKTIGFHLSAHSRLPTPQRAARAINQIVPSPGLSTTVAGGFRFVRITILTNNENPFESWAQVTQVTCSRPHPLRYCALARTRTWNTTFEALRDIRFTTRT